MTSSLPALPEQVEALVFDFDDTLIHTAIVYRQVREDVYAVLHQDGLDIASAEQHMNALDRELVAVYGFQKERFPLSMRLLYERMATEQNRTVSNDVIQRVTELGWSVYTRGHQLMDDVHLVLGALRYAGYRLVLFTKGDEEIQNQKLDAAELRPYFDHVVVRPDKTPAIYQEVLHELALVPEKCIMIGDSIKSDINPARSIGMAAIHIAPAETWAFEVMDTAHAHVSAGKLADLLPMLNASWAVEPYKRYKNWPHRDLLRATRDRQFEYFRDLPMEQRMPDCPGMAFRFFRDEAAWTVEWYGIFEPEKTEVFQGDELVKTVTVDVPTTQWSQAGYSWGATIHPTSYASALAGLPQALCLGCQNRETCAANGIVNGVKLA